LTTGAVVIGASIILFDPLFQGYDFVSIWSHRFYYSDIDCSAVDLLCYGEKEMGILSRSLRRRDVETKKKILNNFNATSQWEVSWDNTIIL
jgi:hypothetical protein